MPTWTDDALIKTCRDFGHNFRVADSPLTQAAEEPPQPIGYVHSALLRVLKNLIVAPSLFANLGRHAVEALRAVSNRAQDISVMARAILPLPSANG
jgi:hypothetical protein